MLSAFQAHKQGFSGHFDGLFFCVAICFPHMFLWNKQMNK
ncbi:hypothetical protein C4J97_5231 [Pseudomonas orientalis]|nr:hypothetical protein C4J97_5231 [Pseudomonas orientalis]